MTRYDLPQDATRVGRSTLDAVAMVVGDAIADALPKYKGRRGAKITTYLYPVIHHAIAAYAKSRQPKTADVERRGEASAGFLFLADHRSKVSRKIEFRDNCFVCQAPNAPARGANPPLCEGPKGGRTVCHALYGMTHKGSIRGRWLKPAPKRPPSRSTTEPKDRRPIMLSEIGSRNYWHRLEMTRCQR
jgi:hypothetical protein